MSAVRLHVMIQTMKKVLLVTTVSGFVPQFELNNVRILQSLGYEVHYASNFHMPSYGDDNDRLKGTGIVCHQIDFVRSPFSPQNRKVYRQLKALMQTQSFSLVHCHTPMGGVMARLCAHVTHTGPVIYTAHGFHFFAGAPLWNWLSYYPMERFLSRYTTEQICINQEDYARAKRSFHARFVDYIPGVGFDPASVPDCAKAQRMKKRETLGFGEHQCILLSVGELIKRKNHETVIRALAALKEEGKSLPLQYVICGHGRLDAKLRQLAKQLGVEQLVRFLGYRKDILEICQAADLFVFPSYQEGLPMALLEAMACGLPVICSAIRGSRDLMEENSSDQAERLPPEKFSSEKRSAKKAKLLPCRGGVMIRKADDVSAYGEAIAGALALWQNHPERLSAFGEANRNRSRQFSLEQVGAKMQEIYSRF